MSPLPDISPALEALKWLLSMGALGIAYWLGRNMARLSTSIEHLASQLENHDARIRALETR